MQFDWVMGCGLGWFVVQSFYFAMGWVGLGWVSRLVGWVGLKKFDPRTTLNIDKRKSLGIDRRLTRFRN